MIKIDKIEIDTTLNYKAHREEINRYTHCHCSEDRPEQFFVVSIDVPNDKKHEIKEITRYYELKYSEDGSKLLEIYYWDHSYVYYDKVVKGKCEKTCYFEKNDETVPTKIVRDYRPNYGKHITVWDISKNPQSGKDILPTLLEQPKKKKWGIF